MKLFIEDLGKIRIYNLPTNIVEEYSITYTPVGSKEHCLITLKYNNNWYLYNDSEEIVLHSELVTQYIEMKPYIKNTLKILKTDSVLNIYCIPSENEDLYRLDLENIDKLLVGKGNKSHIRYNLNTILDNHFIVYKKENDYFIMTNEEYEKYPVYLNYEKITEQKQLKMGDIIFVEGLKIIYMKEFIEINNPNNSIVIQGLQSYKKLDGLTNDNYEKKYNEYNNIDLYKEKDYFFHIPKMRENIVEEQITIDSPPASKEVEEVPVLLTMGSTITMGASSFIMAWNIVNGLTSQSKTLIQVLPQIIMCGAMIIGSMIMPRLLKKYKKRQVELYEKKRNRKYGEYLKQKEMSILSIIKNQEQILKDNYISIDQCVNLIMNKSQSIWYNEISDKNFLKIRLGVGSTNALLDISAPEEHFSLEVDHLLSQVYEMLERCKKLNDVPITVSLTQNNVLSFVFANKDKYKYLEGILIQIMTMHSPDELKIVVLTNDENEKKWNYAKVLPHCQSEDRKVRFFSTNFEEATEISNYLMEILKERKSKITTKKDDDEDSNDENENMKKEYQQFDTYYLVITDDYITSKKTKLVEEIVENSNSNYGFSLIAIDDYMKNLPTTSQIFVNIGQVDGAILKKNINIKNQQQFKNEYNYSHDIEFISSLLANIPTEIKTSESILPTSLTFLDMFDVSKIEHLNILNRWKTNNPVTNLNTVVGVHTNGEKFKLNLHEKFHGPHGLIAGMTGSGKSEFIITYILSMAINYHPYEVQFVLIDYKGGGLAGAFENKEIGLKLPHLTGTITNLDTSEMNRTLVSIQSELKRRQKVFNEVRDSIQASTIDIYKYQQLYREGIVKTPMSHLFIISDEFAELKSQQPEFMQQLISTARIGRSLGVHLILATQKPSGVVNEQIWSNSKFKVCLKVQDRSDSMEMLKRPEAASIKETGRFYLQVGYDDYFDVGQSGWSGAKYIPSDKIIKKVDDSINFIDNVGNIVKSINNEVEIIDIEKDYGEQLTNIVKYICDLGEKENIITNKLWLDAIPDKIYIDNLKQKYSYQRVPYLINPVVGEYDNPVNQEQGLACLDLTNKGNTIIYGQTGSGKENLLTTILWSTIIDHTPEEVNFYALDFGAETLKVFNKMPHVGDVLISDDNEKIYNLMNMLDKEIEERKKILSEFGGNYTEFLKNSTQKLPLIITIINNYEVFYENYPKLAEEIQNLYRDGNKYGVIFIISTISTNSIRSRMLQNFNNKICLQVSDNTFYRAILGSARGLVPAKIFGRGIMNIGDNAYEFQTAIFIEKSQLFNYLKEASKQLTKGYKTRARRIPMLPEVVKLSELDTPESLNRISIGYDIDEKQQYYFDFLNRKFIQITTNAMNESKMGFVYSMIKSLAKLSKVTVIDMVEAIEKNIEGITLYNNNFDLVMENVINEIITQSNTNKYYIILGIGVMREKLSQTIYEKVNSLFEQINAVSNTTIILVDTYNSYRKIKIEKWYEKSVDSSLGIWLGKDIGTQTLFDISKISLNDRNLNFLGLGYVIEKDKTIIVKHMIDE